MFYERLVKAVNTKQTSLVVGLDPRKEGLPGFYFEEGGVDFRKNHDGEVGQTLMQWADLVERYVRDVIDLICDHVGVVKFQVACYECLGPAGMEILAKLLRYAQEAGLVTILDGKRGDIGSSARLYGEAYLGGGAYTREAPFLCDAITSHPYLGMDSIEVLLTQAQLMGKGLFVCVKTSNPGSADFQDLWLLEEKHGEQGGERETLFMRVAHRLQELATAKKCVNSLGMVVGATYPEDAKRLRGAFPQTCFLVPGLGHQGGALEKLTSFFGEPDGKTFRSALFNVSRGILNPQPKKDGKTSSLATMGYKQWSTQIRQETLHYKAALAGLR